MSWSWSRSRRERTVSQQSVPAALVTPARAEPRHQDSSHATARAAWRRRSSGSDRLRAADRRRRPSRGSPRSMKNPPMMRMHSTASNMAPPPARYSRFSTSIHASTYATSPSIRSITTSVPAASAPSSKLRARSTRCSSPISNAHLSVNIRRGSVSSRARGVPEECSARRRRHAPASPSTTSHESRRTIAATMPSTTAIVASRRDSADIPRRVSMVPSAPNTTENAITIGGDKRNDRSPPDVPHAAVRRRTSSPKRRAAIRR